MRKIVVAAVLAALSTAGSAHAWQGGRVYFAHNLSVPVKVLIDGVPAGTVTTDGVLDASMTAGVHTIVLETAGGERRSTTWTFRPETLADAKGSRYWCLYLRKGDTPQALGEFAIVPKDLCSLYVEAPS